MEALPRARLSFASWGRILLDVVFPRTCRVCDQPLDGHDTTETLRHWFCQACANAMLRVEPPFCQVCGEAFDGVAGSSFQCTNCADRKLAFDFAIAGFRAEDSVRELIHRFKYNSDLTLRAPLERMMEHALEDPRLKALPLEQWFLVPVPLHHVREREREFNQCRELCRELSRRRGIPMMNALKRTRATPKQAQLTRLQRLKNLHGAFAVKPRFARDASPLRGRCVLLVDDVFTTGATTNECARILKRQAGVEKVVVISVARG